MLNNYFLLAAGMFFAMLFYFSVRDSFRAILPRKKTFTDPDKKFEVLDGQEDLKIEGGELEPDFYYEFVRRLENSPDRSIEFIFGPKVVLESKFRETLGASGKTKRMNQYHPLFRFAHDHPERLTLLLRACTEQDVTHYSVGPSPRLICEENPHPRGGAKTGTFYLNDVPRWQMLRQRFQGSKQRCILWQENVEVSFETLEEGEVTQCDART